MNLTNSKRTEMLNNVAGIFFQRGTVGSIFPVIMFTLVWLDPDNRAKYCGLGCSASKVNPVNPQRCVIVAEYRFHSSRNRVAKTWNIF